jgi:hypothetical protein
MSILKLLFALNPKNLKLVKAAEMTPGMAQEIDSFLGKMGAVVNIGKYELTPSQAKYWRAQRKELTKYENKLNEMRSRNKLKKKEGIETLPEAEVIDFPVKPKPPEGEPFKDGGKVKKKKPVIDPKDKGPFDDIFKKMFSEYEWEKKKKSYKDGFKDGGKIKKSKTDKIIDFLGGKDVVAAELGLLGVEQLYSLLGMPLGFAGGGAVGSPPVYQTNNPKEAVKEIIRRTSFLSGSGEALPIYSNENMNIEAFFGSPQNNVSYGLGAFTNRGDIMLDQLKSGDKNLRFNFGTTMTPNTNFEIGYTEGQGPQFGLQYRIPFNSGGVTSGPPPERGPNPQGLETLFQTR